VIRSPDGGGAETMRSGIDVNKKYETLLEKIFDKLLVERYL
jgi:hypothetical protein